MAANGAGRRARRIEQDGIELLLRSSRRHVGADQLGFERQAGEIILQPLEPPRRAIDRRNFCAGNNKLRRLATGRRDRSATRKPATLPRRRAGVAAARPHPPRTFVETRQRGDGAVYDRAHRAGRQHAAVELCRPTFDIGFNREIERGLAAIGGGDGVRGRLAIALDPTRHQPWWRVENRRIERRDRSLPSRAMRRSTALIRPEKCNAMRSSRASRTARSTAA